VVRESTSDSKDLGFQSSPANLRWEGRADPEGPDMQGKVKAKLPGKAQEKLRTIRGTYERTRGRSLVLK